MFCPRRCVAVICLAVTLCFWQAAAFAQGQTTPAASPAVPAQSEPQTKTAPREDVIDLMTPSSPPPAPPVEPAVPVTNFVSSSISEVRHAVPELRGLTAAESQQELPDLLNKVGNKTVDLLRKMPNLICHEQVLELEPHVSKPTEKDFSYLIVFRRGPDSVTLEEYRMDPGSGASLSEVERSVAAPDGSSALSSAAGGGSGDALKSRASPPHKAALWEQLRALSQQASARGGGALPLTQGFASMWVNFYPPNRFQSSFRYLGRQKIERHNTLVLAFSQIPGRVRVPGEVMFDDKITPVFYQGIAWVDASDFRIVRLRTDLLAPPAGVPLRRLTGEIRFADTPVAGVDSPLWLPSEVGVTSRLNGADFSDQHKYSKYRLFAVQTKIVLNP